MDNNDQVPESLRLKVAIIAGNVALAIRMLNSATQAAAVGDKETLKDLDTQIKGLSDNLYRMFEDLAGIKSDGE